MKDTIKVPITVYITPEQKSVMQSIAQRRDMSLTKVIGRLVERAVHEFNREHDEREADKKQK